MQLRIRLFLAAFVVLFAAACADAVTGPRAAPERAASASRGLPSGNAQGQSQFRCDFQIKDVATGGYRTRVAQVHFPASELHPTGAVRKYEYRAYSGTELVISADCSIPATERARERMDRRFKVVREHGHGHEDEAITTMSEDDCCPTVKVTACQYGGGSYYDGECNDAPDEDYSACFYFGECGGSGNGWDWGTGGGGGGGGGGSGNPAPECDPAAGCDPATACDASTDPDCEKPLTSADSATIKNALRTKMRTSFTDTTAARVCGEMRADFEAAFAAGEVFRGGSTTTGADAHYGAYYAGHIHFDPNGLDLANGGDDTAITEIAITALHEGGHWGGARHPNGATFDSQGRDYYVDRPFNFLNPGPNSCVAR